MNLLIESGATKSICIGYKDTYTFFMYKTTGINANYASKDTIINIFKDIMTKNNIQISEIENVRYYGAGCFNADNAKKIKNILSSLFPNTNITVLSDLYAACHALCKNKSGFVGILGTGAASCFYDGENITKKAPSLGWLLGDEGSGIYLGKQFVKEYLTEKIDLEIVQDFEKNFAVSKSIIFEKVYQTPNPQMFFASIPVFLHKHLEKKQIKSIIENSFQQFFEQQINYYTDFSYPWFFCGSIAYYFQDILVEVAQKNSFKIEKIIQECAQDLMY